MPNFWAHKAKAKALAGTLNYSADDIRVALMASGYTPAAPLTSEFWGDVVASELSATGYVANGVALTTKTLTVTEANSWAVARANTTAYAIGNIVRPATGNGHLYRAQTAGTSGGSVPTFPTTAGDQVTDGAVTWEEWGAAILVVSSDAAVVNGLTATGVRYAWLYDRTPASDATRPLLGLLDFGSGQTWTSTNLTITPDTALGWLYDTAP